MERLKTKIPVLLKKYPAAKPEILEFIKNMQESWPVEAGFNNFINFFTQRYCYYFSVMLKDAFGGKMMVDMENYHIVTVVDEIAYDVNGIYDKKNVNELIAAEDLHGSIEMYKHRGLSH